MAVIPETLDPVTDTVPLKLLTPVSVTRAVPEVPRGMVRLAGLTVELYPAGATSRSMLTVWLTPVLNPVAVTVTGKSPVVAELHVNMSEPVGNVRSTLPLASVHGPVTVSVRLSENRPSAA